MDYKYKVVYYKDNKQYIELTNELNKYKQYTARVYPADYKPSDNHVYGSEELIDSWYLTRYKIVFIKGKEMCIEYSCDLEKYKQYTARVYPAEYEPKDGSYGFDELIDSW